MITKVRVEDPRKSDEAKKAWLAERSKSIGGSEIGTILGLNPYSSPFKLWAERTGKIPAFEGNLRTEVGSYLEQCVADIFTAQTGIQVQKTNFIWRNDLYPVLHATPDRLCVGRRAGLEIKTTSTFNVKQFHGEEFPSQYYAQCVQYMAVCELNEWFLAVLVGNSEFHIYQLVRDREIPKLEQAQCCLYVDESEINALNEAAENFWDMVLADKPPVPDGSEATAEVIDQMYPAGSGTIELFGRENLFEEYKLLKTDSDKLEKRMEAIKNIIKADMGDAELATCGPYKCTWKSQNKSTFDKKRCIAEHPEMAKYESSKPVRVFLMK